MDPDTAMDIRSGHVRASGSRAPRRRERGASLVEFALIVAAFAVGSIAAIDLLQEGAQRSTENTADNLSSGPRN